MCYTVTWRVFFKYPYSWAYTFLGVYVWLSACRHSVWLVVPFETVLFLFHMFFTCLWRWNRQSVPKRRHIKFRRRGITQTKAYNIQNKARVWNQGRNYNICITCSCWLCIDFYLYFITIYIYLSFLHSLLQVLYLCLSKSWNAQVSKMASTCPQQHHQ